MDDEKRELPITVTVNVNGVEAYPSPPPPERNHEELEELLGGDDDGHYHLTAEQYDYVTTIVDERREFEESGEEQHTLNEEEYNNLRGLIEKIYPPDEAERYVLTEEEYNKTSNLLDMVYPEESDEPVFPGLTEEEVDAKIVAVDHEKLKNLQGGAENDHYHITSGEAEKLQKLIAMFFPDGATDAVEALKALIDTRITEHIKTLDSGEATGG